MEQKTREEVFSKKINRILSVVYLTIYAYSMFAALVDCSNFVSLIENAVIVFIIFETVKRFFYYIVAGTPFPAKDDKELMQSFFR